METRRRGIFHGPRSGRRVGDFWHYRRIFYRKYYPEGRYASSITLVNWPQIDYWLGPLVGVPEDEVKENLRQCKQLSLSMLYWMQTEAPRYDENGRNASGYGYPGLRLRHDIVDTDDGLAKYVYVREARRILAEFTVLEQHVGTEQRNAAGLVGAEEFHDSVGIGSYRIDLHPSTAPRTYVDISDYPFQIPLGSLIPQRRRKPAAGLQKPGRHPHHQRLLSAASGRVEHRRGCRRAGRLVSGEGADAAPGAQ